MECATIEILVAGHKNILVTCLYRACGSNINHFVDCMGELFSGLSISKTIFICGDFNIGILRHNYNPGCKLFLDSMYSMCLYPLIYRLSRITNHSFTIIDNIFTNAANYETSSGLLISDISDHLPVFAICKYPNLNRKTDKQFVKKRIINEISINSLVNDLLEENWEVVLNSADVNLAYKSFLSQFLKLFNKCCPIKQVRISNTRRDKPWFTNSLKNACRKKNTLYKKIIRSVVLSSDRYNAYIPVITSIEKSRF